VVAISAGVASLLTRVSDAIRRLESAGVETTEARRDAVVLARAVLGWDPARWLVNRGRPASAAFEAAFTEKIARRAAREPLAYILGEREFYGRSFVVSNAVLVPRPETELVIDRALAALGDDCRLTPRIVDVGTGSGCLAITLALECPRARVVATDLSAAALEVAAVNAARHGVGDRVEFRKGSLMAGVDEADVVVSNPPYVAEGDRATLPREVRDHEPADALFGGAGGLDVIAALVPAAAHALRPGGTLVMEIGAGQWDAVRSIVSDVGFDAVQVFPDLAGVPRVVVAESRRR
jgi:release factor glutamine methyltransferase